MTGSEKKPSREGSVLDILEAFRRNDCDVVAAVHRIGARREALGSVEPDACD